MEYKSRIVDNILDEVFPQLPAIAIEGAKGVGKTATAQKRATTTVKLDEVRQRRIYSNNPALLTELPTPLLIDEWQFIPETWDIVRRAVDDGAQGGHFLLTGSANIPANTRIHSGAGRIVSLHMRPMSLYERDMCEYPVSLATLLEGEREDIFASTSVSFHDYVHEIMRSGFPGIRTFTGRALTMHLDSYIERAVNKNLEISSPTIRSTASLRAWLSAYGAATGTNASYEAILNAATPGEKNKPARSTVRGYHNYLSQLYLLDPIPAWTPTFAPLNRLSKTPTHHLVDPALAVRLTGLNEKSLVRGEGKVVGESEETFLGHLFESLAAQSVRVYATGVDAKVFFLRTQEGRHEIDLIVEGDDSSVIAIEVKLASSVDDKDVKHLLWLEKQIGEQIADLVVLYAGDTAYRRSDGVLVLPLAMLAP